MQSSTPVHEESGLPTEAMIHSVVHQFYAKVRADDLLAPVFAPRLGEQWDEHLGTMVDFWSSVLLSSGRYRGRPLRVHGELGRITPAMWQRWLKLFSDTARELCSAPVAALFVERAEQIAAHLSRSLDRALEQH